MNKQNRIELCEWCGQPSTIVWVHGHGQCSVCGTNIDECCRGESCQQYPSQIPSSKEINLESSND